jgi:histidinol-phosphate phosphatase family protein
MAEAHQGVPALFLDRDGTIIHDEHYISTPQQVALIPGVAEAIRRVNEAGVPVIVVTNQSGIARGLLTTADYEAVHRRMVEQLAKEGAHIDGAYYCPHHPEFSGPCACRKPATLLFQQAAKEHGIDLSRSAFVGDHWRDAQPALSFGGQGILVPTHDTRPDEMESARSNGAIAETLGEAVSAALATMVGPT